MTGATQYRPTLTEDGRRRVRGGVGGAILAALVAIAVVGPPLVNADPSAMAGRALSAPSRAHVFGTDDLGRDVLAGVIHGTRTSLIVGLGAAALSTLVALAVGGAAGMRGGAVDQVLMRGTEFIQALPRFFVIVLVVSLFGSVHALIIGVIGLTSWPATARLFRAQVVAVVGREFVLASRASGGSDLEILIRHVWPSARAVVAAEVAYAVGGAILAEAGLSFLGLGDPTIVSWGALLGAAQHFVRDAWWMSVFPGAAITLTVLACNQLADTLVVRAR